MKVLLIAGGWSSEREVSLNGAKEIRKALTTLGHEVTFLDPYFDFDKLISVSSENDFAFINMHGCPGEDGLIQSILDYTHCPYVGAGPQGSFLAVNKTLTKQIAQYNKIPTAPYEYLCTRPKEKFQPKIPYPVFVKPNTGGSSLNMKCVSNDRDLNDAINKIFDSGDTCLIESRILGNEITSPIVNNNPLPLILIQPNKCEFFDYSSKYESDGAEEICPAPISENVYKTIQKYSLDMCSYMNLNGYCRCDYIVSESKEIFLLEVNTLPGMTSNSLVPKSAKVAGMDFIDLISSIIQYNMNSHHNK